ncbi:HD domain-containing phosphohydrolase [Deinococcus sonorensis]|uniref:HD domain-containing phosphohydrolase n=1 Tax=Deinococcus sonorensis KR-87 TaxID=694439 RepID=A0AAU7U4U2_9DEIO
MFRRCVEMALSATRATSVMALLHRPAVELLEVVAAAGHLAEEALGRQVGEGEALAWRVYRSGRPYLLADVRRDPEAHFVSGRARAGMYLGVPMLDPDGHVLGVLSVDTTDSDETLDEEDGRVLSLLAQAAGVAYARLLALEEAQQSAAAFEQLARLSATLDHLNDPQLIGQRLLDTLLELGGFLCGALYSMTSEGLKTRLRAGDTSACGMDLPPAGMVSAVFQANATLLELNSRCGPDGARRTVLATPVRTHGQPVSVMMLAYPRPLPRVPPERVAMLEIVAARTGQAQERASNLEQLRQTREEALRALGRVVERRDDETFGHTDRVTTLAVRLGEVQGLHAAALQHLRWGAYLHDIGKVAVPDSILRKPGPLTPSEREVMQTHAAIGHHMVQDSEFLPPQVGEVVRHHHERWDGTGYPDQLAGEAIPLLARLFSVVDVYDALITARPYKAAWTREAALAELGRCAGTQFDPEVVRAFMQLV